MTEFLLLGCVGVGLEVVFTCLSEPDVRDGWRLKGQSYVWMFPIYGLTVPFFKFLDPRFGAWPWLARAPLYVLILYVMEYLTGWLLRRGTGRCPWDYGAARWAIHGLIRLDYFPGWLVAVTIFEAVCRRLGVV